MAQQGNAVTLDFANRPSNRELAYLNRLAKDFGGELRSVDPESGFQISYSFWKPSRALEFWNRATMFEDYIEGNLS